MSRNRHNPRSRRRPTSVAAVGPSDRVPAGLDTLDPPELARRLADAEGMIKALLLGNLEALMVAARTEPALEAIIERALDEGLADKSAVIEQMPCGVVVYDERGRLLFANRTATQLSGKRADPRALPAQSLDLEPRDPPTGRRLTAEELPVARALKGETIVGFECVVGPSPECDELVLRLSAVPRLDAKGLVTGAICTFIDNTNRSQLERELLQADRMACVGSLAAGMAHEINNPLTYILANIVFVQEEVPALVRSLPGAGVTMKARVQEMLRSLGDAREGAERIRRVVGELRDFVQPDEDGRKRIDVRGPLDGACLIAESEIRHRAVLIKELGEVPAVIASEGRLRQLFVNLLMNAAQSVDERPGDAHEIRVTTSTSRSGDAVIEVSDTGFGFDEASIPRVFDPFFSIRPGRFTTGFGLATCQSIAIAHGGSITVESEPDGGSVFRVTLPADTTTPVAEVKRTKRPHRRGKILVVDDEISVVDSLRRVLSPDHDVTVVLQGRDAIDLLARGEAFDLVLCDVMMPDMGGFEVYARVAEVRADLLSSIVFMTGGAFTPRARAFLESVPNDRLSKPFELKELRVFVAERIAAAHDKRDKRSQHH